MKTPRKYFEKLRRCWMKLRLRPIRVFCFHHVSDAFEPDTMVKCDWIQTEDFKKRILALKKDHTFISLADARDRLTNDVFRMKHYAVLTADDGWVSIKDILPWLKEQDIPVTLFLNPQYLDGNHFRKRTTERYLSYDDVKALCEDYPMMSIGMHGWEHVRMTEYNEDEFRQNLSLSIQALKDYKTFIPFFAYPWGVWNEMNQRVLRELQVTPVLVDGMKNYNAKSGIHREML